MQASSVLEQLRLEREARIRLEGELAGLERAFRLILSAQGGGVVMPAVTRATCPEGVTPAAGVTPSVTGSVVIEIPDLDQKNRNNKPLASTPGARRTREWRARRRQSAREVRLPDGDGVTGDVTPGAAGDAPPATGPGGWAEFLKPDRTVTPTPPRQPELELTPSPVAPGDSVDKMREVWNQETDGKLPKWLPQAGKARRKLAEAALRRRPIEGPGGWREVFQLARRSPWCRGNNPRGWRASPDWVMRPEGVKPESASILLSGEWEIDPEPRPEAVPDEQPLPGAAASDSPAARAWAAVLAFLSAEGKSYALGWLGKMSAYALEEGVLTLLVPDRFFAEWVSGHYGRLLESALAEVDVGATAVGYRSAEDIAAAA